MNRLFKTTLMLVIFVLVGPVSAHAQNLCQASGGDDVRTVLAYANGILTTPGGAHAASKMLKDMYSGPAQTSFNVDSGLLYNHTEGLLADLIETFEQRVLEKDARLVGRYELFHEALSGGGMLLRRIGRTIKNINNIVQSHFVLAVNDKLAGAMKLLSSKPPQKTDSDLREHMAKIDTWILEGKKILIVAHSQGNLFANAAYQYARMKVKKNNISLVHVAPPSFVQNGPYVLADKDLVINILLKIAGNTPPATDVIPGYFLRPANRRNEKDFSGHGMTEIYLNDNLSTYASIKKHMDAALSSLVTPPKKASPGFFTVTMTWDGRGDVDLHVTEPTGNHVYFMKKRGDTGYLDVDNRYADGPEHYFASCDSKVLTEGVWRIAVKNYRGAGGRTATVQVASSRDGVLATRSVPVGSTKDAPQEVFVVMVKKDPATGELIASLR